MLYIEKLPREILSKFFVRMYTEETSFYSFMNQSLMRKENTYDTFVKVMYEGLSINSLHRSEDDILYRGSKMSKNEIDNIKKDFETKLDDLKKNNKKLMKENEKLKDDILNWDDNFLKLHKKALLNKKRRHSKDNK